MTRKRHILRLPREPSVCALLGSFASSLADAEQRAVASEVCAGLLLYFERSLGSLLLYRIERPQFAQLQRPPAQPQQQTAHQSRAQRAKDGGAEEGEGDGAALSHALAVRLLQPSQSSSASPSSSSAPLRPLCSAYGGEHLLRLLVKLPALLQRAELTNAQLSALCATLQALVRWLCKHEDATFASAQRTFVDTKSYLQQLDARDRREERPSEAAAGEEAVTRAGHI